MDDQSNEKNEMHVEQVKKLQEENKQLASKNTQLSIALEQLAKENEYLKKEAIENHHKFQQLQENVKESAETIAYDAFHEMFTHEQIKRIISPNSSHTWSAEDISSSIALRSVSARAYNYLRTVKKVPLPCVQTLRNWSAHCNVLKYN